MAHEIRIPRLGWSMEEGKFIGWLRPPGSSVAVGEPLFELESEKAVEPVESIDSGILFVPADAPAPGSTVAVGGLLGYLLGPDEAPPTWSEPIATSPTLEALVSPSSTPAPAVNSGDRVVASPRARRVARERGVDWRSLQGTGAGGRIREADVRAASADRREARPLSPRRRAIAERLRVSRLQAIPVTLAAIADATELVALRERLRAVLSPIPAYTDLAACLVAQVLLKHLDLAARWDAERRSLIPASPAAIDIGIAVDTAEGLLVPVVRDVARRSLREVADQSRRLVERARGGRLTAAEMRGGVFTITNLGAYRIDAFTPVINAPEVAVLGLGAIRLEPAVTPGGAIQARHRITLSLTFDHAALDGAPAAAFLRDVALAVEDAAAVLGHAVA